MFNFFRNNFTWGNELKLCEVITVQLEIVYTTNTRLSDYQTTNLVHKRKKKTVLKGDLSRKLIKHLLFTFTYRGSKNDI